MTLTKLEWLEQPQGTFAHRVKTYTDNGNCVSIEYVLETNDDEMYDDIEQAQAVASGYMTDTARVSRR